LLAVLVFVVAAVAPKTSVEKLVPGLDCCFRNAAASKKAAPARVISSNGKSNYVERRKDKE